MIWGENGSGKTAVLEAIHTLSFGKSFRTHTQRSLIRNGDRSFVVKGMFLLQGSRDEIAVQVNKHSGQQLKLNGKSLSGRTEIIGRNNVVVLSPEEQPITKGPPVERRQFFDKMFSVSMSDYVKTLKKYGRVLKQRNAALLLVKENKSGEPVQTIVTTTDILNVESSGLMATGKEIKTYHLGRRCNT